MTMTPKKPDNSTPEGAAELMRADERTSTEIFAVLSARFPALSEAQAAEQAGLSSRSPAPSARKLRDVLENLALENNLVFRPKQRFIHGNQVRAAVASTFTTSEG